VDRVVKATTAQRMLIGIGVFLGVGLLLMLAKGDPGAGETARQLLAAAVFVGGMFWLGYRFRVLPRRESFRDQADALAFRADPGDPLGLLDIPFTLFRWTGSVRAIENTAVGRHRGRDVAIADYWFSPTSAAERDDYERYTCVVSAVPEGWSDLLVVPERFGSRLLNSIGIRDIETESEAFNRTFQVRAADRRFASAFVDARLMEWLLGQEPGVGFEVLDGRVLVFRQRATISVDDVSATLALFDAFTDRIPRVVGSAGG
jgi:hypothetical protein